MTVLNQIKNLEIDDTTCSVIIDNNIEVSLLNKTVKTLHACKITSNVLKTLNMCVNQFNKIEDKYLLLKAKRLLENEVLLHCEDKTLLDDDYFLMEIDNTVLTILKLVEHGHYLPIITLDPNVKLSFNVMEEYLSDNKSKLLYNFILNSDFKSIYYRLIRDLKEKQDNLSYNEAER